MLFDDKVLVTIRGNVYVITLGLDVGTDLVSLYGSSYGSYHGKVEGLFIEVVMVCTDGKVLRYDEGFKLGLFDGKGLGIIPGNVDGITLGIDVGAEIVSLDGSFDVSNDDKLEGLLLGDSL